MEGVNINALCSGQPDPLFRPPKLSRNRLPAPSPCDPTMSSRYSARSAAGNPFQRFPVFQAGLPDDFFRQVWGRRLTVPADRIQVVPHILFVKAWLGASRGICIFWPEPG